MVTNAHVVAGEHDTTVQVARRRAAARRDAVAFDAANDVAVLRVAGLDAPALPLAADAARGDAAGAILGFPQNGPYDVRGGAARRRRATVLTQDAYGRGPGAAAR